MCSANIVLPVGAVGESVGDSVGESVGDALAFWTYSTCALHPVGLLARD